MPARNEDDACTIADADSGTTAVCTLQAFKDAFLSTRHVPVEELEDVARAILSDCASPKLALYDSEAKCWPSFPPSKGNAGSNSHYCVALMDILNVICAHPEVLRLRGGVGGLDSVNGAWFNTRGKPTSEDPTAIRRRPDVSWLLCPDKDSKELEITLERIRALEVEIQHRKETRKRKRDEDMNGEEEEEECKKVQELKRLSFFVWLRTIVAIEVKPDRELTQTSVVQVATYLRQIVKHQQDRQFTFALLLLHDQLMLWCCDRTGLLGTCERIDIHRDPKSFLQVMISLMLLPAHALGWDRTMKIVPTGEKNSYQKAVSSWDNTLVMDNLPKATMDLNWEITIGTATYRTLRLLSAFRGEVLGRACLVWEAVNVGEKALIDTTVIIKQSWSPCGPEKTPEAKLYAVAGREAELVDYERVSNTSTLQDLRSGLAYSLVGYVFRVNQTNPIVTFNNPRPMSAHAARDMEEFWLPPTQLVDRQLDRLVFRRKGIPLKYSKDLKELLRAFSGALEDYQQMYERHGVCHRDISIGNILVVPGKGGILIDLDHAKVEEKYKPTTLRDLMKSGRFSDEVEEMVGDEGRRRKRDIKKKIFPLRPTLDARSATLLLHIAEFIKTIEAEKVSPRHFEDRAQDIAGNIWDHWVKRNSSTSLPMPPSFSALFAQEIGVDVDKLADIIIPPTFLNHEARTPWATGTPGFISHALLGDSPAPIHLAIHDMESFFSTLLYVGLTREGCGAKRRDEYPPTMDDAEAAKNLFWRICRMRYLWYENNTKDMKDTKALIFKDTSIFTERVLVHLSEYFEPVKPLLLEWYLILQKAFRAGPTGILYNFPITAFRAALDKQLETIPEFPNSPSHAKYIEMRAEEEKRRKDYDDAIKKDIWQLKEDRTASTSKVTPTRDSAKQKNAPTYGVSPSSFVLDEPAGDGADVPIPEQDGAAPDNFFPNFLNRASPVSPSPAPKRPRLAPNGNSLA